LKSVEVKINEKGRILKESEKMKNKKFDSDSDSSVEIMKS
jgi:hypothetical protein